MSIIGKEILSVGTLLCRPLRVPDYQRPYKWGVSHVHQLVDDLLFHIGRPHYRLGTVVLHHAEGVDVVQCQHAIVDGQQRLVTLTCCARCSIRRLPKITRCCRQGSARVRAS